MVARTFKIALVPEGVVVWPACSAVKFHLADILAGACLLTLTSPGQWFTGNPRARHNCDQAGRRRAEGFT